MITNKNLNKSQADNKCTKSDVNEAKNYVRDGCARFISEQKVCLSPHTMYVGDSLVEFSQADVRTFQKELDDIRQFKSEVSIDDVTNMLSTVGDQVRDMPNQFFGQLDSLSKMIKLLSDKSFDAYTTIDGRYLADLLSQALMALKLISAEPSITNLTLVFTCCVTKLNLPEETYQRVIDFVKKSIEVAVASISSFGYKSEGAVEKIVDVMSTLCNGVGSIVEDKIIDVVVNFLAKLVAFWATVSGGFSEDDFKLSAMSQVVNKVRSIIAEGGDLIEALMGAYEFVTENWHNFIKGDFSALFFGKAETRAYETRVSIARKVYILVKNGSDDVLKEEYNMTPNSFDAEVADLIKIGDRQIKKVRDAQRPALKRMLDELREIQTDRLVKQAQTQTKMSAVGICFVGGSGVGKSLLMEKTAKTLIQAAGEIPSNDQIVSGQMSDKFDSNELPHHLVLMYDDVANNSANENFDKLLNAVNSQSRPFLKASVEEKGVMFPGNVGCVISTNVLGFNAKKSNCPDSLGRRFLHVRVSVKESLVKEVCTPGTKRIDSALAMKNGPRFDVWKFEVFEFVTFDPLPEDDLPEDVEKVTGEDGTFMYARRVVWTDKEEKDYTFWDLALFLGKYAQKHYNSQKELMEKMMSVAADNYCSKCCVPQTYCTCNHQSEFISGLDDGINRVVANYETLLSFYRKWWDITLFRAALGLSISMCPIDIRRVFTVSFISWALLSIALKLSLLVTIMCAVGGTVVTMVVVMLYAWRRVYNTIATRAGILSHLARSSVETLNEYKMKVFVGAGLVSFAYLIYKAFRPKSEYLTYREQMPETIRAGFLRAEKARTTPIDAIMPLMKRDLGVLTVRSEKGLRKCLAFPIESNFYLTVSHIIPEGEFEVTIVHENERNPTVAKQKLSSGHIYRFEGKDLCLLQIPTAIPRRGYLDYLNGREQNYGSQPVRLVSCDIDSATRYESVTRMSPGWTMFSSSIKTDIATIEKPYKYPVPSGTRDGMCGSLVVDFSKSLIYGFHVAGNGSTGLCSTISREMIQKALQTFKGFIPMNRGDLQLGSQQLEKGYGFAELEVGDPSVDQELEEHNCVIEGILPGASATFKDPYMKHTFYKDVVEEFGLPDNGPPQQVNHPFHKRKALTKLTSPNQEFSADEVEFARDDYVSDILDKVRSLKISEKQELGRKLTLQEALDGIGEKSLGGIDNSTSVGFPYKGKKMNYLARDEFDETQPLVPRKLVEFNGVNMEVEVQKMIDTYKSGKTCRPLFKCSMKTNELLPNHKFKARVFMGSNFPFLLVCRMYLAPFIRMASRYKYLFETAKGINMDSVEAEELHDYLKENEERIVALDYSAFDQTMSVQVSSAVSACILDIMRDLGCSEEHLFITRGILTDINYPNLHFFGTILQLANSDPSGNPITTELNGGVNSIYLRIFFFRLYPKLKGIVRYRQAIRSMTYGDDNISSVPEKYSDFNGTNIVRVGKDVGLTITMANKDADITDFTHLTESDFLKRKFRYCPDMKRIRAPLVKESITKSLYYMKKTSPESDEELFRRNVDGALRKSSQHGRDLFEEIKSKLLNIARKHGLESTIYWWGYDELIQHDLKHYYEDYRGYSLADAPSGAPVQTDFISESWESSGYRSESFIVPPKQQPKYYRILGVIVDWLLAIFPFVKSGRFQDLYMSFNAYSSAVSLATFLYYLVPIQQLEPWERTWWVRLGCNLRDRVANVWLTRQNEIIRKQPACIVLEGPAGTGKTTLALALVKQLFEAVGGIQKHEIIVLNEEDDFQSEYRSHHRVVILDDVGNTKFGLQSQNPLRRVIDFVNNIPKRALSPEADMKGVIKICPELVIITSNISKLGAHYYSNCSDSIYRRAKFVRVLNRRKPQGVGLDLGIWELTEMTKVQKPFVYKSSIYYDEEIKFDSSAYEKFTDFYHFATEMSKYCVLHWQQQDCLVKMVNEIFDPPTSSWFTKFKSESWDSDMLNKLKDVPPGCGVDYLLQRMDTAAREMVLSGKYQWEEIPAEMRIHSFSLWDRIVLFFRTLFGCAGFKSEADQSTINLLDTYRARLPETCYGDYFITPDFIFCTDYDNPYLEVLRFSGQVFKIATLLMSADRQRNIIRLSIQPNVRKEDIAFYDELQSALAGKPKPEYKSESMEVTSKATEEEFLSFILDDEQFVREFLKSRLQEAVNDHYLHVCRDLREIRSTLTDEDKAENIQNATTSLDLTVFYDGLNNDNPFVTMAGFDDSSISGFTVGACPSRPEAQAQEEGHLALLKQHPDAVLVAREVTHGTKSIDLLYKTDKDGYIILECKAKNMVVALKQAQRRRSYFDSIGVKMYRSYAFAGGVLRRAS